MNKMKWQRIIFLIFLTFFFQVANAQKIDKIVVFGDSLSDNGNIFHLTNTAQKVISLIPLIPKSPPYFNGRFSNGLVWVDHIAEILHLPMTNYAYGGSWAEPFWDSFLIVPFGLSTQVDMYLFASLTDFHKSDHLYVIWSGSNDYIQGRQDIEYATTNTVNHIQKQIDKLISYGARHFLILTIPDLSFTPEVTARGPYFASRASKMSVRHNEKLLASMQNIESKYPGVQFMTMDISNYFYDMINNPKKYNLKNINQACYGGGYALNAAKLEADPAVEAAKKANIDIVKSDSLRIAYTNALLAEKGEKSCLNPDEYLFWDKIHPTAAIHRALSVLAFAILQEHEIYINQ